VTPLASAFAACTALNALSMTLFALTLAIALAAAMALAALAPIDAIWEERALDALRAALSRFCEIAWSALCAADCCACWIERSALCLAWSADCWACWADCWACWTDCRACSVACWALCEISEIAREAEEETLWMADWAERLRELIWSIGFPVMACRLSRPPVGRQDRSAAGVISGGTVLATGRGGEPSSLLKCSSRPFLPPATPSTILFITPRTLLSPSPTAHGSACVRSKTAKSTNKFKTRHFTIVMMHLKNTNHS
jgi:hypothetical protein